MLEHPDKQPIKLTDEQREAILVLGDEDRVGIARIDKRITKNLEVKGVLVRGRWAYETRLTVKGCRVYDGIKLFGLETPLIRRSSTRKQERRAKNLRGIARRAEAWFKAMVGEKGTPSLDKAEKDLMEAVADYLDGK